MGSGLFCSCAPPAACQSASSALAPPSAGLRNVSGGTVERSGVSNIVYLFRFMCCFAENDHSHPIKI